MMGTCVSAGVLRSGVYRCPRFTREYVGGFELCDRCVGILFLIKSVRFKSIAHRIVFLENAGIG